MTSFRPLVSLFACGLLTCAWVGTARADSPAVSWSISGPASCAADVQHVNEEMTLACGAAGGCRIAAPGETAERRAIVTCGASAWNVAARSDEGELWAMRIDGSADDRARKTAMWLARSEHDGAKPPAPPPAAEAAAHVAASPHGNAESDTAPALARHREIAMGAELMLFPAQHHFGKGGDSFGVNGGAAFPIGRRFSLGPSLALLRGEYSSEGFSTQTFTIIRPAARLSWGAPADDGVLGATLDLGTWLAFGTSSDRLTVVPYLQPSIVVQWPHGELRPYVALNGMVGFAEPDELKKHASEAFGPFGVGLSLGVAWSAH